MTLRLPDRWVWDSWYVLDGDHHHAFYLCAPRSLGNPDLRHWNTTIGHAVSNDLVNWQVLPDALAPSDSPAWDSWTTWTGSVIKAPDGTWWMFYTGTSREDEGKIQRIGAATSSDLVTWRKVSDSPLVEADANIYEVFQDGVWPDQAWRDPWVYRDSDGWRMLITARKRTGDSLERGTIGHAHSDDLLRWTVDGSLTHLPSNFGQLEVFQLAEVEGRKVLIFSCATPELAPERPEKLDGRGGGVYSIPVDGRLEDLDLRQAHLFPDPSLYAARLVIGAQGAAYLIGFRNMVDGEFVGELTNPIRVTLTVRGLEPLAAESADQGN